MNKTLTLISSLGIGAGLMYVFDPDKGKRRRAEVRNKIRHAANKTNDAIGKTSRDLTNRLSGVVAEAGSMFSTDKASDEVIVARVRSKLGRLVSHPSSIEVAATDGRVVLSGPVLADEINRLVESVSSIKGVVDVENRLEVHEQAGSVPGLQGGRASRGESWDVMQSNWSPATRLLVGAAGGALAVYATRRRGLIGAMAAPLGLGLVSRALTNLDIKRMVGAGAGRRAIKIQKTINIAAPVEDVFEFWTRQENFPQFMSNVREVSPLSEGKYHWVVAGPAGVSVEWDGEITKIVPNRLIEFRSLPGSAIEQEGVIRFTTTSEADTCVDVKMSYNPPAGAIGHLVAMLFGSDPKKEMDADLMRMKSFIETGQTPHDAAGRKAREAATH